MLEEYRKAMDGITLSPEADEALRQELLRACSAGNKENHKMKRKSFRVTRLLIAAIILTMALAVTAYAVVNARIRMEITPLETGGPNGEERLELDFQKTDETYIALGDCYPRQIPEGYEMVFVSDTKAYGIQTIRYQNSERKTILFVVQLGGPGGQIVFTGTKLENVDINGMQGTLYRGESDAGNEVYLSWTDEVQGFGYFLSTEDDAVDLVAMARSVSAGEPLEPTYAGRTTDALQELGDFRMTALPAGYAETDVLGCPLSDGGGWYSYVRRWYTDKAANQTIYFTYETFAIDTRYYENTVQTALTLFGGGEPTEVQGYPAAARNGAIVWVDWERQVAFQIIADQLSQQELRELAENVRQAE